MTAPLIVLLALALAVLVAARVWYCRRHPAPLRGDWWPAFERDFRQWAAAARPEPEHRHRSSRPESP